MPLFDRLLKHENLTKKDLFSLIISPTRELATQIFNVVTVFQKDLELNPALLLIGGRNIEDGIFLL